MNESVIIQSVDRTLDVIDYIYHKGGEVSITQISKDLKMHKSTVYRILTTLQYHGYVMKNPDNERYYLSLKMYIIGSSIHSQNVIGKIVEPYIERLRDRFGEAVNVSILSVDDRGAYQSVIVAKAKSDFSINANTAIGSVTDCYCCSVGKCLLAFSDNIDLSVYERIPLQKFTETTITDVGSLREEIQKIRECGYAVDNEEGEKGLLCVGAPILVDGKAVAAVSLSGPYIRMKDHFDEKTAEVKHTAECISVAINRGGEQE